MTISSIRLLTLNDATPASPLRLFPYNGAISIHELVTITMNDNVFRKYFNPRPSDNTEKSVAETFIEMDDKGITIRKALPPRSITDFQQKVNGFDPTIFFDSENSAKRVEGISKPISNRSIITKGEVQERLREELALIEGYRDHHPKEPNIYSFEP